jgi:UDPglucose--hexose-1-phosphate uridylyltransferase
MSLFRQNLANKEWVIISPERGKKPNDFLSGITGKPVSKDEYRKDCPFCPGNEEDFAVAEQDRITDKDGKWTVKAIDNRYKVLDKFPTCPAVPDSFSSEGIYQKLEGCGNHEVIIETNKHDKTIIDLSSKELMNILGLYIKRYRFYGENPNNLITTIFKNYGALAGQTQLHSHSQIVGSRVVPAYVRSLLYEAQRHFDQFGSCVFCDIIKFEKKENKRVVYENSDYISFVPFAAGSEHETWILPKTHSATIYDLEDESIASLADCLQTILKKFYHSIGNPNFNYVFRIAPYPLSKVPFYHWYIQILPRTKIIGGFEQATRIPVNTVLPEDSVQMLKSCNICEGGA